MIAWSFAVEIRAVDLYCRGLAWASPDSFAGICNNADLDRWVGNGGNCAADMYSGTGARLDGDGTAGREGLGCCSLVYIR